MDVGDWLRRLGLGQYEAAFRDNAIDGAVLPKLTADDLRELGVAVVGHRRKIISAIEEFNAASATHVEAVKPVPTPSPVPVRAAPDAAERRQLTVMFCDLVGSTAMSARLDPEDMGDLIRAFQGAVAAAVARFDGHVAKLMGDGALVYFGYPRAHEDDAERAARAGLALVEAVGNLRRERGVALEVRAGIATGVVVVGELMGEGEARERGVVGDTPNLAARLQALAEPGSVVVAEATRRLLGGTFELKPLEPQDLKGFDAPVPAWAVVREAENVSRFEAAHSQGMTPFVGREQEVALLIDRWRDAAEGEGQVVLLSGEAGIGKSRILATLNERIGEQRHIALRYHCSPQHANDAFYPIVGQMWRAAGLASGEPAAARLDKLEAMIARSGLEAKAIAPYLASLLSIPTEGRYPPLEMAPSEQKERTIAALLDLFVGLTKDAPVLALLEDAHWIDPTSLDVFGRLIERLQRLRALLVVTFRPEFAAPWLGRAHVTALSLNRFGRRQAVAMIERVTGGKALPAELVDQIVAKTDGVPLFVEELTKTVIESGLLREENGSYVMASPLTPLAIPSTLQDSLMARLDRLAPVKEIAQIGAAIGREFSYRLLEEVSPIKGPALQDALGQLIAAELIYARGAPPEASYIFKHALVQDTAYASLLRSRRHRIHADIARALEKQFPETVEKQPELLAYHYTEAGLVEPAITYWRKAGQRAVRRAANIEAIDHLRRGLAMLELLSDRAAHADEELAILLALGPALMSTRTTTAPEIQEVYGRARQIAHDTGRVKELFVTVFGFWLVAYSNGNREAARSYTSELMSIAQNQSDPGYLLQAHHCAWGMELYIGNFEAAHKHVEAGLPLYDKVAHRDHAVLYGGHDPEPCGYVFDALALQALGRADSSLAQLEKGLARARELAHPPTLIHVFGTCGDLYFLRREPAPIMSLAAEWLSLTSGFGSAVGVANAMMARGWATTLLGDYETGLAELRDGLDRWRSTGSKAWGPNRLGRAVAAFIEAGEVDQGVAVLAEAIQAMESTGQRWYEAELHRLQGLLAASSRARTAEAEACFENAISVAHSQGARLFELRAAVALSRLQCAPEQRKRRMALLGSIYSRFTEGFDTADLKEAKSLLDKLE
ncbi:MAG: adenylate/guanylate cyclase domain-containing protein [Roseiarcus sp.]